MKILITGGLGFIGSNLAKNLLKNGYNLSIIDNLSTQVHGSIPSGLEWLKSENVEFIRSSVCNKNDLLGCLKDVTHIVHLAAETGTGQSMYQISHYDYVNSFGTAQLLDLIVNNDDLKIEQFILASSRSIYGEGAYQCKSCGQDKVRITPLPRTSAQLAMHRWDPLCLMCGAKLSPIPTLETDAVCPNSIYAATKLSQENLVRIACDSKDIKYSL